MMKKIFISFSFLMMAILPVFAQNSHWEYQGVPATSAVTVVHSNGVAYLFQSDGGNLYVQELDPNTMQSLPPSSNNAMSLPILPLYIQGAYEDFSGNIVIYGNLGLNPAAAQYDVSTHQIMNVFLDANHTYDSFINGCSGYDINGIMVDVFVLENQGILIGTDWSGNDFNSTVSNPIGYFSDVLWDPFNSCFAVTGYGGSNIANPQLFLIGMEYDVFSGFQITTNPLAWDLSNQTFSFAEYRTCLEILPNGDFVVGQSLREGQYDWIWLTTTNGYTGTINSAVFRMPSHKLMVLDMKHNEDIGQLVLLGKIVHSCGTIHFLAQVDPYALSSMVAAQVTGIKPLNICLFNPSGLSSNAVALQKLEINPYPCARILATGTYANNETYVTETYDLANSSCDLIFYPLDVPLIPNIGNVSCNFSQINLNPLPAPLFPTYLYIYENWSCQDPMPCSKQLQEKSILLPSDSAIVDWMENGLLEFSGFTGEITYKVYNMLGECVAVGNAVNGAKGLLLTARGLYVITAEDQYGHSATKKFIYLNK